MGNLTIEFNWMDKEAAENLESALEMEVEGCSDKEKGGGGGSC